MHLLFDCGIRFCFRIREGGGEIQGTKNESQKYPKKVFLIHFFAFPKQTARLCNSTIQTSAKSCNYPIAPNQPNDHLITIPQGHSGWSHIHSRNRSRGTWREEGTLHWRIRIGRDRVFFSGIPGMAGEDALIGGTSRDFVEMLGSESLFHCIIHRHLWLSYHWGMNGALKADSDTAALLTQNMGPGVGVGEGGCRWEGSGGSLGKRRERGDGRHSRCRSHRLRLSPICVDFWFIFLGFLERLLRKSGGVVGGG